LSNCDFLENCQTLEDPKNIERFKMEYCLENRFKKCAGYKIRTSLGPDYLPPDLNPDQQERAQDIIRHGFEKEEYRVNAYY
jgi:hypothetical protein